ncbi:C-type mannose receptor 2-like isoform X2 [Pomacea canaliculata]|uniref:C-type mannose receptor 2-like isoform X2 n=1 Tax=Pomacea canaliculata TaxID=400727 RepID=UPI000D72DA7D|nr:C-type mannose receptor 2-like isoform X2 [Pomacea canaliculata]
MLCHVIIVAGAVLFLTYGDVTQATGGCGSDWVQLNSACYYVSRTSANWSTAQTYCRENGGTLLSSNYQKEPIQILWNMTRENQQWWVEMQKTSAVTAMWKWLDSASNLSNETTPWDRSESTDGEDTRDCAEMDYSGLLNDVQCNSSLYFVCEKRAASNANGCGGTWHLLSGVCYQYFTHTLSSWDAQKSCQDKGSELLSISSIDEQKGMLSWLRKRSKRWWVGLQRTPLRSNTWKWVDSTVNFSDHVTHDKNGREVLWYRLASVQSWLLQAVNKHSVMV